MIRYEREMYEPIGHLLESLGHRVIIDSFGIWPFKEGIGRRIDVLGYGWKEGELHTVAVECKKATPPDGIIEAVGQALRYMVFTDECYIGTPEGPHLEAMPILDELGIGYISYDGKKAELVKKPSSSKLSIKDQTRYNEQVKFKLKTLLIFEDFAARYNTRKGGFRDGWGWAAMNIHEREQIQQNVWASEEEGWVFSGLNFEKKEPSIKAAGNILSNNIDGFVKIINHLPDEYRISGTEVGYLAGSEGDPFYQSTKDYSIENAKELLQSIVSIDSIQQRRPELSIHKRVWSINEDVDREEGMERLTEVFTEIEPIVKFLKRMT